MKLDPERYVCPDHKIDLTEQVADALDDLSPPVAYLGPFSAARRSRPRPFQVVVTCPGAGSAGGAGSVGGAGEHQLTCAGEQSR